VFYHLLNTGGMLLTVLKKAQLSGRRDGLIVEIDNLQEEVVRQRAIDWIKARWGSLRDLPEGGQRRGAPKGAQAVPTRTNAARRHGSRKALAHSASKQKAHGLVVTLVPRYECFLLLAHPTRRA
jgi:hypothetical protein